MKRLPILSALKSQNPNSRVTIRPKTSGRCLKLSRLCHLSPKVRHYAIKSVRARKCAFGLYYLAWLPWAILMNLLSSSLRLGLLNFFGLISDPRGRRGAVISGVVFPSVGVINFWFAFLSFSSREGWRKRKKFLVSFGKVVLFLRNEISFSLR
ncbi:hypothetical protein CDAR_477191 [Caerostris darwini]|uniref:Transmembrane protein n=1 Tax=Caerostris darwini TaxID=1538125 RepID=A0AAV4TVT3_9ARAC|nr:hypothetical protein CDAR_477191 [Caerostris darwini]